MINTAILSKLYAALLMLQLAWLLLDGVQAAGPTYKQYKANLKADLLVLDVGGFRSLGNHPLPFELVVYAPGVCQFRCDLLPGCTGWTFCNKQGGCGSGCKSYAAANPTPGGYTGTGPIDPNTKLPIKWFGPLSGQQTKCVDDKWALGICSLKSVPNPRKPQFWSTKAADGWVSGVVLLPPECKGLSAATCRRCAASKNPAACRTCAAAASKYAPGILSTIVTTDTTWSEGCAACAALPTALRNTCSACLAGGKPCGKCAVSKIAAKLGDFFDTASCVNCAINNPAVSPECLACAAVKDTTRRSKCGACVTGLKAFLVQDPNGPSKFRIARGDFCATCAQVPNSTMADKCVACGKATPYNDDCRGCAAEGPATQAACYECAFKVKLGKDAVQNVAAGGAGKCTDCLGDNVFQSIPTNFKPQCKACLYDPKVIYGGKYWCTTCVDRNIEDPKALKKCIDCLKLPGITDYFSQCVQPN